MQTLLKSTKYKIRIVSEEKQTLDLPLSNKFSRKRISDNEHYIQPQYLQRYSLDILI